MFNGHGRYAVCNLPIDKARECKLGVKSHYVSIVKEENNEQKQESVD
jgi:hypothetical protein